MLPLHSKIIYNSAQSCSLFMSYTTLFITFYTTFFYGVNWSTECCRWGTLTSYRQICKFYFTYERRRYKYLSRGKRQGCSRLTHSSGAHSYPSIAGNSLKNIYLSCPPCRDYASPNQKGLIVIPKTLDIKIWHEIVTFAFHIERLPLSVSHYL